MMNYGITNTFLCAYFIIVLLRNVKQKEFYFVRSTGWRLGGKRSTITMRVNLFDFLAGSPFAAQQYYRHVEKYFPDNFAFSPPPG